MNSKASKVKGVPLMGDPKSQIPFYLKGEEKYEENIVCCFIYCCRWVNFGIQGFCASWSHRLKRMPQLQD